LSAGPRETRPKLRDVSRADGDGAVDRLEQLVASVLEENEQLRGALESRIVIEQAKGMLAERYRLDLQTAFELLRGSARNHRMSLHVLAESVVASRETPPQIEPPHVI
jgi:AmiR/NasT family two-component response regulator